MEEERDIVVFSDDEGNEFELEVIDYFDHEDQEYAVLVDPHADEAEDESEAETEVYIMKVVVNGEFEEFLPADENLMETLSDIVEKRFEEWECECDDDCECECDEKEHTHCDCGCDKH